MALYFTQRSVCRILVATSSHGHFFALSCTAQIDCSKLDKVEAEFATSALIPPKKFPKKHCECKGCSARRGASADINQVEPEMMSFLASAGLRMEAAAIAKQFAEFGAVDANMLPRIARVAFLQSIGSSFPPQSMFSAVRNNPCL